LLSFLPAKDFELLEPNLKPIELPLMAHAASAWPRRSSARSRRCNSPQSLAYDLRCSTAAAIRLPSSHEHGHRQLLPRRSRVADPHLANRAGLLS